MFNWRYMLIPVSVVLFHRGCGSLQFRELMVFGVRLAYWTVR